jgi:putative ABC transport system permease protein
VNLFEALVVAVNALRANRLRSVLTMLGIIIGIAAVITMVTLGAGAQRQIDAQIAALGSNVLVVFPGAGRERGARTAAGTRIRLTEGDAAALRREIPDLVAAAPTIRGQAQIVQGNENWATTVQGIDGDFLVARDWRLAEGREFEPREIRSGAKVVLLGATVAEALFGESRAIGQTVRVGSVPFRVTGILERKGQNMWGGDQDDVVMMPLAAARSRVLGQDPSVPTGVGLILVSVRDAQSMPAVEEQVEAVLRQRHRVRGSDNPFNVQNMSEMLETRAEAGRVFNLLLAAVASVSLLVGGIGIMNIMLVSVTERTREIGLRRAVGARPRDILVQFLVEAVVLCSLGGCLGIAAALLLTFGLATLTELPVALDPGVMALAVLFSAAIGVFFGYYPAQRAARQDPIVALRHE